jgi:hypothetical protein
LLRRAGGCSTRPLVITTDGWAKHKEQQTMKATKLVTILSMLMLALVPGWK